MATSVNKSIKLCLFTLVSYYCQDGEMLNNIIARCDRAKVNNDLSQDQNINKTMIQIQTQAFNISQRYFYELSGPGPGTVLDWREEQNSKR